MMDAKRLREVLDYDPLTGVFLWKVSRKGCPQGRPAGSMAINGYHTVRIDYKLYRSARLAWLYMTGEWPKLHIDHRNCIRNDNRWVNLREATISQNGANRFCRNSTGFKGVALHRKTGLFRAELRLNGVCKSLGYFKTPEEAHKAYAAASKIHHGEFARAA